MRPFNKFRQEYEEGLGLVNFVQALDPNFNSNFKSSYKYTESSFIMASKETQREKVTLAGGYVAYLSVNEVNAFQKYMANKKTHINYHEAEELLNLARQTKGLAGESKPVDLAWAIKNYESNKAAMFRLSEKWIKKYAGQPTPIDSLPHTNTGVSWGGLGSRVIC